MSELKNAPAKFHDLLRNLREACEKLENFCLDQDERELAKVFDNRNGDGPSVRAVIEKQLERIKPKWKSTR